MQNVKGLLFWAAMFFSQAAFGQVTFVIDALPKATPPGDTIFISGTFNGWTTDDPDFMLHKRLDGKYTITLPSGTGTLEYKFTRGSWLKTETDENNAYRPNRIFTYGNGETVNVQIANWQDLGGAQPFDFFALYFFAISFQGLICVFLLFRIKNYDQRFVQPLAYWVGVISLLLFGRSIYEIVSTNWQAYLSMAVQIMIFITGPLLYFIGKKPVSQDPKKNIHFLPAFLILVLTGMKAANFSVLQFLSYSITNSLTLNDIIFYGAGIAHNFVYLIAFAFTKRGHCQAIANYGIVTTAWVLLTWLINHYQISIGWHHQFLTRFNLPLLLLSIQILALTYLSIKKPTLFKSKDRSLIPEIEKIKTTIHQVMDTEKPYRKSDLSLNELADIVGIKPHVLSKVVNEEFHYNFRDFVNKYRVEEFIRNIQSEHYKNYTYLAVAYEVGFNAKSTFNVAFKRFTNTTPREFFKRGITN